MITVAVILGVFLGAVTLIGYLLRRRLLVVTVEGVSMEPLMVKRAAAIPGDPVPPGVAVPDRLVPAGHLVVVGDNAAHSTDSRTNGFLQAEDTVVRPLRHHRSSWGLLVLRLME